MTSQSEQLIKEFRELNIDDLHLMVEHGKRKQYIRSSRIEAFLLSKVKEAREEVIGEDEKEWHGLTDCSVTNNQKIWASNNKIQIRNELRAEQRSKL
jgi:hypothetical protein